MNGDLRLDLLRHGQAEGEAVFRGRCDDPLSARGWRQMAEALDRVSHHRATAEADFPSAARPARMGPPDRAATMAAPVDPACARPQQGLAASATPSAEDCGLAGQAGWDGIVSSPARRCAEFAAALAERHGLPLVIEPAWRELDFGDWDGRPAGEIDPQALAAFWRDPVNHGPPAGESLADLQHRVIAAWQPWLAQRRAQGGGHWLLVLHAGVIRVLLAEVLAMPLAALLRLEVPPACLSRVRVPGSGQPSLIAHNLLAAPC